MSRPRAQRPQRRDHRGRRQRWAWYAYDGASSGYVTPSSTVLFTPYLTAVATAAACSAPERTTARCHRVLHVLGVPVAPGSLALYTVTAATVLAALVLPVVGAVVDRSRRPRLLLGACVALGAPAAAAMAAVAGQDWPLGVALLVVTTLALTSSLVVYNALLARVAAPAERDDVSTRGWATGYAGGGLLLAGCLALLAARGALGLSEGGAVRVCLLAAGAWWGLFSLVPVLGLRALDGPPVGRRSGSALGQLVRTLRGLRGHPQALRFLAASLFINDGVQTVISSASLYGQAQLHLPASDLVVAILLVQVVALGGALAFGRLAARVGTQTAIMVSLGVWLLVVVAGLALPARRFDLFCALAVGIGLVLGGTQALSRSLFSRLVPARAQGECFSLYQGLERGTSWSGTLVFALVYQLTGSYRPAIASLVAFFALGGLLLARVDVPGGTARAAEPAAPAAAGGVLPTSHTA